MFPRYQPEHLHADARDPCGALKLTTKRAKNMPSKAPTLWRARAPGVVDTRYIGATSDRVGDQHAEERSHRHHALAPEVEDACRWLNISPSDAISSATEKGIPSDKMLMMNVMRPPPLAPFHSQGVPLRFDALHEIGIFKIIFVATMTRMMIPWRTCTIFAGTPTSLCVISAP
jgi:hypothetical protein